MAAAQGALIGNGEAVCLLLDAPDEGEHRRAALDADLLPVRRDKGARAVAVVLDHAEDRQEHAHFRQGGADRLGVHGTAVDEQGVRPLSKAAVAVEIMTEAAAEHLPHGGVVVLIRQAAHLKALVIALFRLAVLEDRHGGDDVRPRNVRDIIGLEAARRFAQTEHALQQHERTAQAFCL